MQQQDDIGIQISIKQESRCWVYWLDVCWIRIWAGIIIRTSTQIRATRDQYNHRHIDASAQVKFNLISFQKYPVPFESRLKADGEGIYHFLITPVFLSQGEGWDLFIYALIHSALSDSRATYGLFWTLLAVRQEYCNNLCPLFCNNCSPFAPPSKTWIYKQRVTFQLVLFSPQGSSQPWLRLTQEMYKHTDTLRPIYSFALIYAIKAKNTILTANCEMCLQFKTVFNFNIF